MARPDVTLGICTDGLDPRFTTLYPLGDRPANASNLVLSGTITNGGSASISTLGGVTRFGTADPTYHAEVNGGFYHLGNSVALASAWGSNTFSASTSGLRHANVGSQWKTVNDGRLSTPYLSDTLPSSSKKLYLSYHTKFGSSIYRSTVASIASKTGNLNGGTDRARGEVCNITLTNLATTTAYVTYEDGSYITLDFIGTQPVSGDLIGATVVGTVSGNTVVLGTVVAPIGSAKYDRVMHGNTGSGARSWFLRLHTSNGSFDYDYWDADGTEQPTSGSLGDNLTAQSVATWEFHELEIDLTGVSGWAKWSKNGATVIESTDIIPDAGNTIGLRPTLIGMDLPGISSIPESAVGALQFIDSVIFNTSRHRVILTDNSVYASSTKWETQPHTRWFPNKVDFIMNRGEITTGGWLHVIGGDGAVIDKVEAV